MSHKHEMNCQDILKNLNKYIDNELDPELCDAIEAHLQTCPECKIVFNTLKKTIQIYHKEGQETELPQDVRDRLFVRLNLEEYVRK